MKKLTIFIIPSIAILSLLLVGIILFFFDRDKISSQERK